jgi:apolipoprotein D and lipocalin family protein
MKLIFFSFFFLCFLACRTSVPLAVVDKVDLDKYSGRWYEIASFPTKFQKGCKCTVAEYTLQGSYVRVKNQCNKDSIDGKVASVSGKAIPVENSNNAKLKVQFFWPFKGDYWIIDLDTDYTYAVVGHPNREYLWILSRSREMQEELYKQLVQNASEKGFDITKLIRTVQNEKCNI